MDVTAVARSITLVVDVWRCIVDISTVVPQLFDLKLFWETYLFIRLHHLPDMFFLDTLPMTDGIHTSLHKAKMWQILTPRYHMWSRNGFPFRSTCIHSGFKWSLCCSICICLCNALWSIFMELIFLLTIVLSIYIFIFDY